MSTPKLDFNTGRLVDPTESLQRVATSISSIMEARDKAKALQFEQARQAKADERAELLFKQKQKDYEEGKTEQQSMRDLLSTWNPNLGNSTGLENQQDRIAEAFNKANAKAEAKIAANGWDAEKGDGDKIAKAYDEAMYGGKDADVQNARLQNIFDSNTMSKSEARQDILQRAGAEGISADKALTLADELTKNLVDRPSANTAAAKQANELAYKNASMRLDIDKANASNSAKVASSRIKASSSKRDKNASGYAQLSKELLTDPYYGALNKNPESTDVIQRTLPLLQQAGVPADVASNLLHSSVEHTNKMFGMGTDLELKDVDEWKAKAKNLIKQYAGRGTNTTGSYSSSTKGSEDFTKLDASKYLPKRMLTAADIENSRREALGKFADKELDDILGIDSRPSTPKHSAYKKVSTRNVKNEKPAESVEKGVKLENRKVSRKAPKKVSRKVLMPEYRPGMTLEDYPSIHAYTVAKKQYNNKNKEPQGRAVDNWIKRLFGVE